MQRHCCVLQPTLNQRVFDSLFRSIFYLLNTAATFRDLAVLLHYHPPSPNSLRDNTREIERALELASADEIFSIKRDAAIMLAHLQPLRAIQLAREALELAGDGIVYLSASWTSDFH